MTPDREQIRRDAAEQLERLLWKVLDEDEAIDAAMVVLNAGWQPPAVVEQAERERDEWKRAWNEKGQP